MNTPPPAVAPRRILILRIGKIGDMIVSNFVFRKIRQSFPDARIMLVTLPRNRDLLRYNRTSDRVVFVRGAVGLVPLMVRITAFRPDLLIDLNDRPSTTSAVISSLCRARTKAGFSFPGKRLTHPVACPPLDRTHITERLRLIPEAIGLTFAPGEVVPSMDLGREEAEEVRRDVQPLRDTGRRCVAVNLSAGDPGRYWPIDRWRALIAHAAGRSPSTVFILLTAPGEERLARSLEASLPDVSFHAATGKSFHHFASYIAQADLLISPDTSAVHIASAFRVPVLGLYPAVEWNFRSWQPVGTRFEVARPTEGTVADLDVDTAIRAHDLLTGPAKQPAATTF